MHSAVSMNPRESLLTSDGDCLIRCRSGDLDAFRFLVQRYESPLCSWLTGRLRDRNAAEEVAQEAFVRAWLSLERFQSHAPFFPWLCGIAAQVARERHRARRRTSHLLEKAAAHAQATNPAANPAEPDMELGAAIDALPEAHRNVILLRYYGQCSCKEVADRLGLPLGTVTKQLSRAHAELRDWFQKHADQQV